MAEKWRPCFEQSVPSGRYELLRVCEDKNGLELLFCDERKHIRVTYPSQYLAYRCCDEADRWKGLSEVLLENGEDYFRKNLISVVGPSELKKWFMRETSFGYREEQIQHHAFVTQNDVVDVLALGLPLVAVEDCFCAQGEHEGANTEKNAEICEKE